MNEGKRLTFLLDGKKSEVIARENETVLQLLQRLGLKAPESPCGGRGLCKKCIVNVDGKSALACRTLCKDAETVTFSSEGAMKIAMDRGEIPYPADGGEGFLLACDIGTTTLALSLVSAADGQILTQRGMENPQRAWGADIISRIKACTDGELEALRSSVADCVKESCAAMLEECGAPGTVRVFVAGNTVMEHIFAGINPESIGVSPFTPASLFGGEESINGFTCPVYFAPAVAGYVGGDVIAGMVACGLCGDDRNVLYIDVGTNGEMALGRNGAFTCCAAAAGPAFEGAEIECGMTAVPGAVNRVWLEEGKVRFSTIGDKKAAGICGSGLIDAVAVMLRLEVIDETGYMEAGRFYLTDEVWVSQADVRQVQLAKAAIAAGIEVLMAEKGVSAGDVDVLMLAGGFGSYIDAKNAAAIGLIPKKLVGVTRAVGNAALRGAVCAAVSAKARADMLRLRDNCEYTELSVSALFSDKYVENMMFE